MDPKAAEEMLHVRLRVPSGWEETLTWCLQQEGWGAVIAEQAFPSGILEGEAPPRCPKAFLTLVCEPSLAERFNTRMRQLAQAFGWGPGSWSAGFELRRGEDWETLWRKRWRPFRCGAFVIHADFHDRASLPLRAADRPLQVQAGSAFGTGGHSSTRMALRALQGWFAEGRPARVLDLGTGSGILAVAAALLGAERVAGMDPDPASAPQARRTAAANGVAGRCRFWRGVLESVCGRWDVVCANLHSDLIVASAAFLADRCAPGGRLFAGGILDLNRSRTLTALEAAGFQLERLAQRGRWITAELRR